MSSSALSFRCSKQAWVSSLELISRRLCPLPAVLGSSARARNMEPEELRAEISKLRAITDKPFGVDILFATIRAEGDTVTRYTDAVQGHGRRRSRGAGTGVDLRSG